MFKLVRMIPTYNNLIPAMVKTCVAVTLMIVCVCDCSIKLIIVAVFAVCGVQHGGGEQPFLPGEHQGRTAGPQCRLRPSNTQGVRCLDFMDWMLPCFLHRLSHNTGTGGTAFRFHGLDVIYCTRIARVEDLINYRISSISSIT